MSSERIIRLIAKRYEGTCTPSELQELDDWYASFDPAEKEIEKTLLDHPHDSGSIRSSIRSGVHARLKALPASTGEETYASLPLRTVWKWRRLSLVACAVLLLTGVITFYIYRLAAPSETISIATRTHETSRIVLPDRSVVWLKPGSRIRYAPDLGEGKTRELFLEGEGLFSISHNPQKPFTVHAGDIDVKVLGTVFNVSTNSKDRRVETTLFKGSVRIEKKNSEAGGVTLVPDQKAVYSNERRQVAVSNIPAAGAAAAALPRTSKTSMIFAERPFEELLASIEQKFEVTIYMNDRDHQKCPITADLEKESLTQIMDLLKMTYGIDYAMYGRELFIDGAVCKK